MRGAWASSGDTPWASRPVLARAAARPASPTIISVKKIPTEITWAEFWKVWFMPPPAPRSPGGQAVHDRGAVGRGEHAHRDPVESENDREHRIGEVDREQHQEPEADRRSEHAAAREPARAEAVGQIARERAADEHARPSAEGCRSPPTAGVSAKRSRASGSQIPCSQMISMNISPPRATADRNVESVPNVNARIRNSGRRNIGSRARRSIDAEGDEQGDSGADEPSTRGLIQPVGVPRQGRMPYVTATMRQISPRRRSRCPTSRSGALVDAELLELQVRPHGPEQPHRNRDQEHQPPVDRRQ